jgi:hypothetical protein
VGESEPATHEKGLQGEADLLADAESVDLCG